LKKPGTILLAINVGVFVLNAPRKAPTRAPKALTCIKGTRPYLSLSLLNKGPNIKSSREYTAVMYPYVLLLIPKVWNKLGRTGRGMEKESTSSTQLDSSI
jgi:hypothetical protein